MFMMVRWGHFSVGFSEGNEIDVNGNLLKISQAVFVKVCLVIRPFLLFCFVLTLRWSETVLPCYTTEVCIYMSIYRVLYLCR